MAAARRGLGPRGGGARLLARSNRGPTQLADLDQETDARMCGFAPPRMLKVGDPEGIEELPEKSGATGVLRRLPVW